MPKRTTVFAQWPWVGGLNTSLDETLIPASSLTLADNVLFNERGTKLVREGIDYDWDDVDLTVVGRSSAGTTHTLVLANYEFQQGDRITVTGTPAQYVASAATVTSVSGNSVSYTNALSLTESFTSASSTLAVSIADKIVGLTDFWFGDASRTQQRVAVNERGNFARYSSGGVRTVIPDAGAAYSSAITKASFVAFENRLIIAVDGQGNQLKYWDGSGSIQDVTNTGSISLPPKASIVSSHIGRVFCNDKEFRDKLHYSETGSFSIWQGEGDSGAQDIGEGDGDPSGITAIFPTFKGDLFVAKRTKLYRITGNNPDTWTITKVSDGIGCISHTAVVAVDQDDIYFVSDRGLHSLVATDAFGAFTSAYKSADIQGSVNDTWDRSRLSQAFGGYLPEINSIFTSVEELQDDKPESLWLYNVVLNAWYRWPNQDCNVAAAIQDNDRRRIYLGTSTGRIARTFSGEAVDVTQAGVDTPISVDIRSGYIYVDGRPDTVKMFKKLGLIYKSSGTHTITVGVKIDNYSDQTLVFTQATTAALLGVDFILGQSVWGRTQPTLPYMQQIDGVGRGIKIRINKADLNPGVEFIGFVVEYEPAGDSQETRTSDNA